MISTTVASNLIAEHKHANPFLTFSDIREWPDAAQAFARFINEMASALRVIQSLRQLIAKPAILHEKRAVEALFRTVVQATADYYFDARNYALRCAKVAQPATEPELKILLDFELTVGPYIRDLNDAMSVLQGYTTCPLQVDRPLVGSAWDSRDWCIERLVKLITSYKYHLAEQLLVPC